VTAFQIILVLAFGGLLAGTAVAWVKGWASRPALVAWAGLWLLGLVAAVRPDATTRVAALLGIRRGADLLLYCSSMAMLGGFFMMYVRLRRVRSDLTVLTRQVALMTAHERGVAGGERDPEGVGPKSHPASGPGNDAETFLKTH